MPSGPPHPRLASVRALFGFGGFRRLLTTRLLGQAGDGVFQVSLAGAVFFDPTTRPDPAQIAGGFAFLLLPYSLVGPFAGVFLDRWSRQRVLVTANVLRAPLAVVVALLLKAFGTSDVRLYLGALAVLSANRFILSALSASLPSVVSDEVLVTANSVATTAGSLATAGLGAGSALALRSMLGASTQTYATIALLAGVVYLVAGLSATRLDRQLLGPHHEVVVTLRHALSSVAHGLVDGARHLHDRRPAAHALSAMAAQRFLFGIQTVGTLLLYRYHFHRGPGTPGLAGLAVVVGAASVGYAVAAVLTPRGTAVLGKPGWVTVLLAGAGVVEIALGLPLSKATLVAEAFLLGIANQGAKIAVDTIVAEAVDESFRGRVFSLYDTLFNVTFVLAAVAAAILLPHDGRSIAGVIALGIANSALGLGYGVLARRGHDTEVLVETVAHAEAWARPAGENPARQGARD